MAILKPPVFYRADPFKIAIWLHDADPTLSLPDDDNARGFDLSQGQITVQIGNLQGFSVTPVVEPFADQTVNKGWVWVRVNNTAAWPLGSLFIQPSLTISSVQKAASIIEFTVAQRV